jgi:hypothetical protein
VSTWAQTNQGDMVLPLLGHGAEAIERDPRVSMKVKIQSELRFFRGEWFLDQTRGFPWLDVAKKNPNLVAIRHQLQKYILAIPGVLEVTDLALRYDRRTRDLGYSASVRIAGGDTVTLP